MTRSLRHKALSAEASGKSKETTGPDDDGIEVSDSDEPTVAVRPWEADAKPNKVRIPEFMQKAGLEQIRAKSPVPLLNQTEDEKRMGAGSGKKTPKTKAEHDSCGANPKRVPLTSQSLSLAGSDSDSDDYSGPKITGQSLRPTTSAEEFAKSKVTTGSDDDGSEVFDSEKPTVAVPPWEANATHNKVEIPEFMKKANLLLQQLHAKSPAIFAKQTEDDNTASTIPETISIYTRVRIARREEKSNQQGQQSMAVPASVYEESYMDEADTWKSDSEDSKSLKEDKPIISSSGDDIITEAEQAVKFPRTDDSASESSSSSSSAAVKGTSDLPWGLFKSNSDRNAEPIPELPPSLGSSREIKNTTDGDQAGLIMNRRGRDDIKKQYSQGDEPMLIAEMDSSWILPLRTDLTSSWVNPAKAVDLDPRRPIFAEVTHPNAPHETTLKSEANRVGVNPSERATNYTALAAVAYHMGTTCTDPKPGTAASTATSIAATASPSISKSTNDPGVGKEEGLENSITSFVTSDVYDVPPIAKENTRTANMSDSSEEKGNISPFAGRVAAAAVDNNTVTKQTSEKDEQKVGLWRSTHRSKVVPRPWLKKARLEANSAPTPEWKEKLLLSAAVHKAQATKEKESTETTSSAGLTATPKTKVATGGSSEDSTITISVTASVLVAAAKGQASIVSSSTHRSKAAAPGAFIPISGITIRASNDENASSSGDNPFSKRPEVIPRNAFDKDASSIDDNPFSKRPETIPRNAFDKVPESTHVASSIVARATTASTKAVISSNAMKSSTDFESWVPRIDPDLERKNEKPSPTLQKYEADRSAWESGSLLSWDQEKSVPESQVSKTMDSTSMILSSPEASPIATTSRALQDEVSAVAQAANESLSTAARSANENQSLPTSQEQPPQQISAVPARSKRSIRQLPSSSWVPAAAKTKSVLARSARVDFTGAIGMDDSQELKWVPDGEKSPAGDGATTSGAPEWQKKLLLSAAVHKAQATKEKESTEATRDSLNNQSATLENTNLESANQDSPNSTMTFDMDLDEMEEQRAAPYDERSRTSSRVSFGGEETFIFDDSEDHFYKEPTFVMDLDEMEEQQAAPYDEHSRTSSRVSFGGVETFIFDDSEDHLYEEPRAKHTCRLSRLRLPSLYILLLVITIAVALILLS